ncbi:MAG: hypothetical protein II341_06360 [Oscillospiraceae bacterium]|nr:hypothetical protein [Oscillospiraceae bacterium]
MTLDLKKRTKLCSIVTFIITAAVISILSFSCPLLSDDWHFYFVWEYFDPLPSLKRVESMQDILLSMQNYYLKSGGRIVPHFVIYCIMTCPKWVFNILNGPVFAAGCYLSYRLMVLITKRDRLFMFPLVSLLHFALLPSFGDNVLWLSGSINYLWPSVLLLFCIYWLYAEWEKAGTAKFALMLPVFMLSAATNEITGGMLLIALLLRVCTAKQKYIRRCILMAVCMIPSICLVILAPGNTVRRMTIEKSDDLTFMKFIDMLTAYWRYMFTEHRLLMYSIVIGLFLMLLQRGSLKKLIETQFFFIVGMAGISALALLGFFTHRPIILGFVVLLPAMYQGILTIDQNYRKHQKDILAFLTPLLQAILFTAAFVVHFQTYKMYDKSLISILAITGILITSLLCIVLAARLPKIIASAKISEKDRAQLDRMQQAISAHRMHIVTGCMVILGALFLVSLTGYLQWNRECRVYQQKVEAYIVSGDLEGAYHVPRSISDKEGWIPMEYYLVPDYYYVEWLAAYHGADTEEFVQKYAVPARKNNS